MAMKPITVSQLNRYIGRILQTDPILGNVSVTGEISNIKYHSTGHVYFTLKDQGSKISCFMAASTAKNIRYQLTDGMDVVIAGYLSVYEKGGYYSLNVRDVEISGEGALHMAFKALYEKLLKEGLFNPENKKPIPVFPGKVCVITSPTGAAVRDILKIIRSRNDMTDVLVYPCLVQGDRAAADIAGAIDHVNASFNDVDVIIVGRGGGSLEELWAFNEEIVARSIFASRIPVISAVGHETDFSISDYAADMRAETPTAAAVMAVPDTFALKREINDNMERMKISLKRNMELREAALRRFDPQMMSLIFSRRTEMWNHRVEMQKNALLSGFEKRTALLESRLENFRLMLEAGNPENSIKKGFAVIREPETGKVITDTGSLSAGDRIEISLRDGSITADIVTVTKA
ncbi:MAG: exodeoxyribonuclease VII large subunit, partial [Firmicutes bacterium]|nr:exodeoxyribonuclease VII large subunit [Bacillota bacterium]